MRWKGARDVVTEADVEVELLVKRGLAAFPVHRGELQFGFVHNPPLDELSSRSSTGYCAGAEPSSATGPAH